MVKNRRGNLVAMGMAVVASLAVTAASPNKAEAQASCQPVQGHLVATITTENCTSPVLLCTKGTITGAGPLNGATTFTTLALAPSAGLAPVVPPTTVSYTGDLTVTTRHGSMVLRDVGLADFVGAVFTEFDGITSGAGSFSGASGKWFISGGITGGGTGFDAEISGTLCGAH